MSRKARREYPGATAYRDRHGKRRWRYRAKGFSVELGTEYGSEEFVARYNAAVEGRKNKPGAGAAKTIPRSIAALIAEYYKSPQYLSLKNSTKAVYRGILEEFKAKHGTKRADGLRRRHIRALILEKATTPTAANRLRSLLKMLMELALDLDWRDDNPVITVKNLKVKTKGFHTWSEDEIDAFYKEHPFGTLAHRAMTLMLYTGAARVDVVKLGWGNIRRNRLRYRRQRQKMRAT